jgi:hypothetical protein
VGYYKNSVSAFCAVVFVTVPVFTTWQRRLHAAAYAIQWENVFLYGKILTPNGTVLIAGFVLDFSDAQRLGLQIAYGRHLARFEGAQLPRISHDEAADRRHAEKGKSILNYVKGCAFHWGQSTNRVARIAVPLGQEAVWNKLVKKLMDRDLTVVVWKDTWKQIVKKFPKCQKWAKWWMHPDRAWMAFPCMKNQTPEWKLNAPSTNNNAEAFNRDEQRMMSTYMPVAVSVLSTHVYAHNVRMDYHAVESGQAPPRPDRRGKSRGKRQQSRQCSNDEHPLGKCPETKRALIHNTQVSSL